MRKASRNPLVTNSASRSPLRSSRALVATVVPILTTSILSAGTVSPGCTPSKRRMPSTAASSYCSGFSDSSLAVMISPSGLRATMSVNVPPRSIQNCQRSLPRGSCVAETLFTVLIFFLSFIRRYPGALSPAQFPKPGHGSGPCCAKVKPRAPHRVAYGQYRHTPPCRRTPSCTLCRHWR